MDNKCDAKIIYIVTDGEYSDYKICGVFDDPELAKEFQEAGGYDGLQEYVLNAYIFQLRQGWNVWNVLMQKNGDAIVCKIDEHYLGERLPSFHISPWHYGRLVPEGLLAGTVLARNEEHAIKIVNEKRGQVIAGDKWIVQFGWVPEL